jgi:hypothetical protein
MRRFILLAASGYLLAACATDGSGGSMLETAASYDPTGLAGSAVAYGSMAAAMAGAVNRTDEAAIEKAGEEAVVEAEIAAVTGTDATAEPVALEDVDLKLIGSRLADLAEGRMVEPQQPDLMGPVALGLLREHGPQVARTMLISSLTGGMGIAGNLPGIAEGVMNEGSSVVRTAQAQQRINDAYEQARKARIEAEVVPDADRPEEARVLLSIADGPPGRPKEWSNDETGAAGRVIVTRDLPMEGGVSCRLVQREWRAGDEFRSGEAAICRQDGDWYQLG